MNFPVEQFRALRTPFYYYDMNLLQQTLDVIKEGIKDRPNYHVHYAVKANANPRVLQLIAENGFGTDSVSGGEVQAALDAGVPADKIVFAGVGKADWEIELGISAGIYCFNVESVPELEIINELAQKHDKKVRVAFRINPEVDADTHKNITTGLAENKFGIAMQDMLPVFQIASQMSHVEVLGLHFHIGSQITKTDPFKGLALRVNELQQDLAVAGFHVQDINVGGGLGIDYVSPDENPIPDFKAYFDTFAENLDLRPGQHLHCELGRSVVGQCGAMISKCLYLKEGVNRKFAILDAGFTELMRPALYQAVHVAENITSPDAPVSIVDIVGPICESSDVFEKGAQIPMPKRGDLIAFRSAGAYGEIMASTYNCRTLPVAYYSTDFE